MLVGLSGQEFNELLLSVGRTPKGQRPLSPVEVGEKCEAARMAGVSKIGIADALNLKDVGMIGKFLRMNKLNSEVRHLVSWGRTGEEAIGFSVADQVARLPIETQSVVISCLLKNALSRDEMKSVVQLFERSGQDVVSCVDRVVRRRGRTIVRTVILGAIGGKKLQNVFAHLPQKRRDEALAAVIQKLYIPEFCGTAKLGIDRFAIVGGRELEKVSSDRNFEERISNALQKGIGE